MQDTPSFPELSGPCPPLLLVSNSSKAAAGMPGLDRTRRGRPGCQSLPPGKASGHIAHPALLELGLMGLTSCRAPQDSPTADPVNAGCSALSTPPHPRYSCTRTPSLSFQPYGTEETESLLALTSSKWTMVLSKSRGFWNL